MKIPVDRDVGPALGDAGMLSVGEVARYNDEELSVILSGEAIGNSVMALGDTMTQAGARLRAQQIRAATEEESVSLVEGLLGGEQELRDRLQNDASIPPEELSQRYLEGMAELSGSLAEGAKYPAAKLHLRERVASIAAQGHAHYRAEGAQRQASSRVAQLGRLGDDAARRASLGDYAGADTVLAEYGDLVLRSVGVLDEDDLARHEDATLASVAKARADYEIAEDPEAALRSFEASPDEYPGLDLVAAKERAKTAGRDARVMPFLRSLDAGTATIGQLNALRANEDITPETWYSWAQRMKEEKKAQVTLEAGNRWVDAVRRGLDSPQPANSDYRKAVDAYWTTEAGPALADAPLDVQLGEATKFVRQVGVVPQGVRDRVGGELLSLTKDAPRAAAFIDTLREVSPGAIGQFQDRELLHANVLSAFAFDPATAVERAEKSLKVPEAERKVYKEQVRERYRDAGEFGKAFTNALESSGKLYDPWGTEGLPEVPVQLLARARTAYEEAYAGSGGKHDVAMSTAAQVVSRDWGVSRINGKPELMRYAPEKMFAGGEPGAEKWMRADLVAEMAPKIPEAEREGLADRLVVTSDVYTGQSQELDYRVGYLNAQGSFEWLPDRWFPDPAASPTLTAEREKAVASEKVWMQRKGELGKYLEAVYRGAGGRSEQAVSEREQVTRDIEVWEGRLRELGKFQPASTRPTFWGPQ